MKLAIFSHCALDTISLEGSNYEQIGGAASYCGIMARELKFDVDLLQNLDLIFQNSISLNIKLI